MCSNWALQNAVWVNCLNWNGSFFWPSLLGSDRIHYNTTSYYKKIPQMDDWNLG